MSTSHFASKLLVFALVAYNCIPLAPGGFLNINGLKNSLFNWTFAANACTANSGRLLNLVNLVCSTAQAVNSTARDACYGCFSRFVPLPQGQQQLVALSLCANMYFANTPYAGCATRLVVGNTAIYSSSPSQCTTGYCEFVQCLRRTNSDNLITQCSREVRAAGAVNITIDADNVRYFTNITSCVLAKSRCSLYNPITGDLQLPGVTNINKGKYRVQVPIYNSLQISPDGSLRVIAFPSTAIVSYVFCSSDPTLRQSNWINNECP
ncbi:uncharacterized protein LOC143917266 [Arctopsyche grandis]|uniref:uncharacterized protein LOC143917266 n=1 Tax=Arctopsyche grandis TaxID=121162 RepID=UPI00406D6706